MYCFLHDLLQRNTLCKLYLSSLRFSRVYMLPSFGVRKKNNNNFLYTWQAQIDSTNSKGSRRASMVFEFYLLSGSEACFNQRLTHWSLFLKQTLIGRIVRVGIDVVLATFVQCRDTLGVEIGAEFACCDCVNDIFWPLEADTRALSSSHSRCNMPGLDNFICDMLFFYLWEEFFLNTR